METATKAEQDKPLKREWWCFGKGGRHHIRAIELNLGRWLDPEDLLGKPE
jgi:hypothetical protein